ncbi:MAG: glycoside hydrolase family 57 [Bryobacterales bacterium]|nr:glycoside hydrolase family 57 [Bryobacterales bacterium]
MKYLCVHAHFYQPPRENPWLEQVELQDSAYPYHDWNDRISAECYAPNLAARILDDQQRIVRIVNNYSKVSFNFGPTLLSWAVEHAPTLYHGLIESDKQSQKNFSGHGSAMAQAYNHMILPLANSRDKKTQIRWGIEDFVSRFGRLPEGMWLPETAVDLESLSLMAEAGLSFAILAPHQAKAVRALKGNMPWQDVTGSKIDPSRAYLCNTPSGRSINLFFYDGPISQAVAFEKLLDNGEKFARRLTGAFSDSRTWPQLMHIATDGETYGHHHRHGEMALAYSLDYIESKKLARITNYGEFLEHNPPECEVQIYENTAWSCVHGVERWRSNCGCNSGRLGWHQEWRQPLRGALDWLRDAVNPQFEALGAKYLKDPWIARDAYISVVLDRSPETRARFGEEHFRRKLTASEQVEVWKLMELQRHAMLMYTSCGWFFDDLSGIETVQVIQYAGRVVQLAEQLFKMPFEGTFLEKLALAKSNLVEYGDGANIYERYVKPSIIDLEKVGAHYSISSLFSPYGEGADIFSYSVKRLDYHTAEAGKLRMALGNARFTSKVTQESEVLTFWVVHFGDHNVAGGVQSAEEGGGYQDLLDRIRDSFERVDIPEVVRLLDKRFGKTYSLRSLFRDEQRRIVKYILSTTVAEAEAAYLQLYDHHAALMRFITRLGTPMPREFTAAIDYGINSMLRRACSNGELDGERIGAYLREALASNVMLDKTTLEFSLRQKIEALAVRFASDPSSIEKLDGLRSGLKIARQMPFIVDVWSAQNHVYAIQGGLYERMRRRALRGDSKAKVWLDAYLQLSELLMIRVQNS